MTRQATEKDRQHLSLAPHVKRALQEQAKAAGLDVSAYVTSIVMEREERKKETKR